MTKVLRNLLIAILLAVCLAGCGGLKATIPGHIAAAAVTRQAQQEQMALWQQLTSHATARPELSVNHVKVREVHPVQVADERAYEVIGTYRYKLRYPQRSPLKRSQVPFSLILQAETESHPWQLLEIEGTIEQPQSWHWQPLLDEPRE